MDELNTKIYRELHDGINNLLTEKFAQELKLGKYSHWALSLTPVEIIPMLSAIGK